MSDGRSWNEVHFLPLGYFVYGRFAFSREREKSFQVSKELDLLSGFFSWLLELYAGGDFLDVGRREDAVYTVQVTAPPTVVLLLVYVYNIAWKELYIQHQVRVISHRLNILIWHYIMVEHEGTWLLIVGIIVGNKIVFFFFLQSSNIGSSVNVYFLRSIMTS